jgi:hypothetical protein
MPKPLVLPPSLVVKAPEPPREIKLTTMGDLKSLFSSDPFSMAPIDINTRALEIWRDNICFSPFKISVLSTQPNIDLELEYGKIKNDIFIYEG